MTRHSPLEAAEELHTVLRDLNAVLEQWCALARSAAQCCGQDTIHYAQALASREALAPRITHLIAREAELRPIAESCAAPNELMEATLAAVDRERRRTLRLRAEAAELDCVWAERVEQQIRNLAEDLALARAGQKMGRAYAAPGRAAGARFLDQNT